MGLFSRFRKKPVEKAQAMIPAGQRVYCVGDIHGRVDLLQQLHAMIMDDVQTSSADKTIVYLGDYIDRGESSKQVIDLLLDQPLTNFKAIYLRGNHEQCILDFMLAPETVASWLNFGGREALSSYGINLARIPTTSDIRYLGERLNEELPDRHRDFFQFSLPEWRCGNYYFVHAGICPGVALEDQQLDDQLWIRDEFLNSPAHHGAIIVHGHTISPEPVVLPNRIGIDTGAYSSGVLTCLILEDDQQRFIQTGSSTA